MPPITIHPLTTADIPTAVSLGDRAFTDPLNRSLFPPHLLNPSDPDEARRWRINRIQKSLAKRHSFKAVDEETGKIVGVSGWFRPGGKQWEKKDGEEEELPSCMDKTLYGVIDERLSSARERVLGASQNNVWYLASLLVDPDLQGQGIGKNLMQWGIEQAEKDGVPVYLEGSPAGLPLYEKCGFRLVESTTFSKELLRVGEYVMSFMVREPSKRID